MNEVSLKSSKKSVVRLLLTAAFLSGVVTVGTSERAHATKLLMTGAGSTFINPLFSKWFSEYNKKYPGVEINYQSIGSGGGIKQLQKRTINFAASDVPMSEKEMADAGAQVLHFPVAIGAVVLSFNLPGVASGLKLDGAAVSAIVRGQIKKWDDPKIKALNPGIALPSKALVFVYRSDSSGTTGVFTDYLSKVDPSFAKEVGVGKALKWPTGLGGKGNEGVTANIKNTEGAIGYVELTYALNEKLPMAAIKNQSGVFATANLSSVTEAAAQSLKMIPADFIISLTNAAGTKTYPIASFTYLLAFEKTAKPAGDELVKLMNWALDHGQAYAAPLGYAPLPKALVARMRGKVGSIAAP